MKRLFQILFLSLAVVSVGIAQETDPDKALKVANRNIANYNLDPSVNAEKLGEAIDLIEMVVKDPEYAKSSKAWQVYGSAYNAKTGNIVSQLVVNPEYVVDDKHTALKAFKGYSKALEFAEKSYEEKDALTGIGEIIHHLNYLGSVLYQDQDYELACENFDGVVKAHNILAKHGEETPFKTEKEVQDQKFYAALTAMNANKLESAKQYFLELRDADYDNAAVYEALYKLKKEEGMDEEALAILEEGREKYPDDKALMYAEINDALAAGKLKELTEKLAVAMEKDPENISIPTTLGNVHDQLFQEALADSNMEAANKHYEMARKYYVKALEIDSSHFDAIYSLGALEYNLAAHYSQEMNLLADDYSPAGTKKYDAKKVQMMEQFDKALPYFIRAEKLEPNDLNTLLALREIYARKDQLELSNKYKEKIEALETNGE